MTFNRTLSQLADEYFEQAQVLDGIIARHRKRLSALPNPETRHIKLKLCSMCSIKSAGTFWKRRTISRTTIPGRKTDERYKNNNTFGRNGSD